MHFQIGLGLFCLNLNLLPSTCTSRCLVCFVDSTFVGAWWLRLNFLLAQEYRSLLESTNFPLLFCLPTHDIEVDLNAQLYMPSFLFKSCPVLLSPEQGKSLPSLSKCNLDLFPNYFLSSSVRSLSLTWKATFPLAEKESTQSRSLKQENPSQKLF